MFSTVFTVFLEIQVQVGSRTFEAQELQKLIPQLEEAIQVSALSFASGAFLCVRLISGALAEGPAAEGSTGNSWESHQTDRRVGSGSHITAGNSKRSLSACSGGGGGIRGPVLCYCAVRRHRREFRIHFTLYEVLSPQFFAAASHFRKGLGCPYTWDAVWLLPCSVLFTAHCPCMQISICKSAVFAVHQHASETLIRMEVKKNFIGFAFAASLIGEKVGVGCRWECFGCFCLQQPGGGGNIAYGVGVFHTQAILWQNTELCTEWPIHVYLVTEYIHTTYSFEGIHDSVQV